MPSRRNTTRSATAAAEASCVTITTVLPRAALEVVGPAPRDQRGQVDVLGLGERGQQVEELEDEAEVVTAQPGEIAVLGAVDLLACDVHLSRCRRLESPAGCAAGFHARRSGADAAKPGGRSRRRLRPGFVQGGAD
jgi:hypothetical protein